MTLPTISWDDLKSLQTAPLKTQLFSILQHIAVEMQQADRDDPHVLATVPRLSELIEARPDVSSFRESLNSLARAVGLWNYINPANSDARDALVAHAVTVDALGGIALHREQIAALNVLLSGQNLILSAPTSFGKSLLIDALLLSGRYNRVAIVVPTIALLDEFRRRLVARFGSSFDVLMHHSEPITRQRVIFLGTQERLINRKDIGSLDLAVVDEFYKLDPARRDERSVTLNAAVYQLLKKAKQFFFLGPNIEHVRTNQSPWRFEFLKTRFSTVAVDTIDFKGAENKDEHLREELYRPGNWPALVFVSSPDKAIKLAADLVSKNSSIGSASDLAGWIDENYGGKWNVSKVVAAGIGIHHGRIPRSLASRFVKLFNDHRLPILICTSTLIEGVNTAAKSVLIYDKTINRESYDFFTFSNIRGRAGRLGQHHVGKVFLFHTPPDQTNIDVNPPLFGDLDSAPDEFVVHVDPSEVSRFVSDRIDTLRSRLGLTTEEVRRIATLGVDNIEAMKDAVEVAISEGAQVGWSGRPEYFEIRAVCELICAVRPAREFGVVSASQLSMYLNELRKPRQLRDFFRWHASGWRGDQSHYENVFRFLRACEYSLPEYFGCV
jgi:RAD3-like DEAD/DEAH box helicase/helicase-like protein